MRTLTTIAVAGAAVMSLASCSFNLTADSQEIADQAANALQQQVGADITPNIDCGDDSFALVEGETRVCALTVDGDDDVYDATIVITRVDGREYSLDVEVAHEPR